jgi:perosamine synthetase
MGWLDHDRLGFNYRLDELSCALGLAQLERLDELLEARARAAALYAQALPGIEGLELPCPDEGGDVRSWFVYVVQLPRGVDRDATVVALRERGIDSKPYLPAIHLMSFYRERFGHRPRGERAARRGRGSAHRLDQRHEPGQPARRRPVGHLLEARVEVQRPRRPVVERGVE